MAIKDRDLGLFSRLAHPGLDREAERLQHQRRRFCHHPKAEKADAAFLGPNDPGPTPLPIGLSRLIARHVAMQPQHVHNDVFGHHRIAARRFDLAEWDLGHPRMVDIKASTPADRLNIAFRLGKSGRTSKLGRIKARYSISRKFPASGHMRISKSGIFSSKVSRHAFVADILIEVDDE